MAVIKRKCIECDETFCIDDTEQKWYADKDFTLPKRCKSCRAIRRNIGKEATHYGQKKK